MVIAEREQSWDQEMNIQRVGRATQREAGIPAWKVLQLLQVGKVRNLSKQCSAKAPWPKYPIGGTLAASCYTTCSHLLNPCNCHLFCQAPGFALSGEVIVHLASAEE